MNKNSNKTKKNKYFKIAIILILVVLAFILYTNSQRNQERIKNRDMTLLVYTDGKVFVEDIWDVNVVNSSTLFQSFDTAKVENFSDIKVSYYDKYVNSWKPMVLNKNIALDGRERLNYYHAGIFRGSFEIAWGVGFENSRGQMKYKVEYTVDGPVTNYLDTAQYYHMLVGKDFELPIENFSASITFAAPINEENSYIWGHGAPSGLIEFDHGKVKIKATKIYPGTFVEGRALIPKEVVYRAPELSIKMKDSILREEEINTRNTKIAVINDDNKPRLLSISIAALILGLGIVISIEAFQIFKLKERFPQVNVRKWERYTDLPQTKLDIVAANLLYDNKGAMNFFVTVLMKLSHNKYLEIIELNETVETSIDLVDTGLMERIKITEEVCSESGLVSNPIEIAKILAAAEKEIRQEKAKELKLKAKDLDKIRYKLNLAEIEKAKEEGKLDKDEMNVIKFLEKTYSKGKGSVASYNLSIKKALKKNKSVLSTEVFEKARKRFFDETEMEKGYIYIEQYQLISELVKGFETFNRDYQSLINQGKIDNTKEGIYSVEKEKKASSLIGKLLLEIAAMALIVYGILNTFYGEMLFNEHEYIVAAALTLIPSLAFIFINKLQNDQLTPHLTNVGLNINQEYQGLFNFLNNDSFIAEYPEESIIIWGEFLVLATYFGIASKVLKTLRKVHPKVVTELENVNYGYTDAFYMWTIMDTVNLSKRNIAMANTATIVATGSSFASGGGGGGFTSGGGGGFGGGGGGSR